MDKWMYPFEPYSKEGFERFLKAKIANRAFEIEKSPEDFITAYIKAKEDDVNEDTALKLAEGSLYNHENALKRLKAYCQDRGKNLRWQLFDESFLLDFRKWCNETKKYAPNTITGQFSKMKEWMRVADGKGLLKSKAYEKWPTKKYDSDNIALTEDEIEAMYKLDFSALEIKEKIDPKSNIEKTRDLFIIACWTGLRFGDYSNLHKAVIDDNFIRIPTSKTNELISLPIHPLVRKIIDKYNGVLPDGIDKSHSIKHLKKCGELAGVDSITIIRKIKGGKQIIQKEPKYTFIGNHTARRSFATNQYRRGIPSATIMAITGHKTEENFLKYIKISKEEHATIIAQSWQSNP